MISRLKTRAKRSPFFGVFGGHAQAAANARHSCGDRPFEFVHIDHTDENVAKPRRCCPLAIADWQGHKKGSPPARLIRQIAGQPIDISGKRLEYSSTYEASISKLGAGVSRCSMRCFTLQKQSLGVVGRTLVCQSRAVARPAQQVGRVVDPPRRSTKRIRQPFMHHAAAASTSSLIHDEREQFIARTHH